MVVDDAMEDAIARNRWGVQSSIDPILHISATLRPLILAFCRLLLYTIPGQKSW